MPLFGSRKHSHQQYSLVPYVGARTGWGVIQPHASYQYPSVHHARAHAYTHGPHTAVATHHHAPVHAHAQSHYHKPPQEQLFEAIKNGDITAITRILSVHPALIAAKQEDGASTVMVAVREKQTCVVEHLLGLAGEQASALVNMETDSCWTPALRAIQDGNDHLLHILTRYGASLHQINSDKQGAVLIAAKNGRNNILRELLASGMHVDEGKIHSCDGYTPLMWAVGKGHRYTAEILLHSGANAHFVDADGKTALGYAEKDSELYRLVQDHMRQGHGHHGLLGHHAPSLHHAGTMDATHVLAGAVASQLHATHFGGHLHAGSTSHLHTGHADFSHAHSGFTASLPTTHVDYSLHAGVAGSHLHATTHTDFGHAHTAGAGLVDYSHMHATGTVAPLTSLWSGYAGFGQAADCTTPTSGQTYTCTSTSCRM